MLAKYRLTFFTVHNCSIIFAEDHYLHGDFVPRPTYRGFFSGPHWKLHDEPSFQVLDPRMVGYFIIALLQIYY